MDEWRAFLLVVHVLSTMMMAAPLYMLIIVNERARFGAPLGYYTDRYMENIIRNNAVRCFVFQGTMAASGLGLIYVSGLEWSKLVTFAPLVIKWVALLTMVSLLSYVHFYLQPRIEALISQVKPDSLVPQDLPPKVAALRIRRKRLSGICLFLVLAALIMGLRTTFSYNTYLAVVLIVVAAIFAWRAYKKPVPLGWI
jgi:hypothetical protein